MPPVLLAFCLIGIAVFVGVPLLLRRRWKKFGPGAPGDRIRDGETFSGLSGSRGTLQSRTQYRGTLKITFADEGIILGGAWPFGWLTPPRLVPRSEVSYRADDRFGGALILGKQNPVEVYVGGQEILKSIHERGYAGDST